MNLLLDAHVLIWALDAPERLGGNASIQLADPANNRFVSAAVLWEIAIKVSLGKLTLSLPYREWVETGLRQLQAETYPVELAHTDLVSRLPQHHNDPFDRMLAAQALVDDLVVVSVDPALDAYGVSRVW